MSIVCFAINTTGCLPYRFPPKQWYQFTKLQKPSSCDSATYVSSFT